MEVFCGVQPSATCLPGPSIETFSSGSLTTSLPSEPTVINTEGFFYQYSHISPLWEV